MKHRFVLWQQEDPCVRIYSELNFKVFNKIVRILKTSESVNHLTTPLFFDNCKARIQHRFYTSLQFILPEVHVRLDPNKRKKRNANIVHMDQGLVQQAQNEGQHPSAYPDNKQERIGLADQISPPVLLGVPEEVAKYFEDDEEPEREKFDDDPADFYVSLEEDEEPSDNYVFNKWNQPDVDESFELEFSDLDDDSDNFLDEEQNFSWTNSDRTKSPAGPEKVFEALLSSLQSEEQEEDDSEELEDLLMEEGDLWDDAEQNGERAEPSERNNPVLWDLDVSGTFVISVRISCTFSLTTLVQISRREDSP